MTLEEKIAQLGTVEIRQLVDENNRFSLDRARELLRNGIGQITRVSGGLEVGPREAARLANEIQRFLVEKTRLGIPAIIHEECLSGFMAKTATTFPQAIGLASTWNPKLVVEVADLIRRQMRMVGAHQGLAPLLDVARDPRWGRVEETFGEDPYLVAAIGVAYIRGLQGEDLKSGVIATPKHFAGYSFSEGGRNLAPVHVGPREFREVFLYPFEAAVKLARAYSLMNAYHEVDGVPCAASRELLTDILRGEWGFEGFVVSDYWSISMLYTFHFTARDAKEAAIQALTAGVDVELPNAACYGEPLREAVEEGLIPESVVDEAVRRVLRAKLLLGLFENPYVDVYKVPESHDDEEGRRLALQAARESIVLLKNDGILPLNPQEVKSIAVIGPNAASTRNLIGNYGYTAHLGLPYDAVRIVSILEGLKNRAGGSVEIRYAKGCGIKDDDRSGFEEAVEAAKRSDVVIAVMGERSGFREDDVSGEGKDRASLTLPGVQGELLDVLLETGKPLILVLVNGRPLALESYVERCAAIIEAWYPGEEGGNAVADVIFGFYNPSGRLPVSFPRTVGQIPVYYNRRHSSMGSYVFTDSKPLFPFGYGLSYTEFKYRDLRVKQDEVGPGGEVEISFILENIGSRKGAEVCQLYVRDVVASVTRPVKELKGFAKVQLAPGEKAKVTFRLPLELLAFYDKHMRLVVEPGEFEVMVGASSEDIKLKGSFRVVGKTLVLGSRRAFLSSVSISKL